MEKSLELQAQIRRTQMEAQASFKELLDWEREMKEKEKLEQQKPLVANNAHDLKALPVRSQLPEKSIDNKKQQQYLLNKQLSEETKNTQKDINATKAADSKKHQQHKEAILLKEEGNKYVKLQQYEPAIEKYTAASKLCPNEAVYYTNRALCYLKLERYEDCIKDCNCAIELDKTAVKAYYRRMQANEHLGNLMDAVRDCKAALKIEPKNSEAQQSLNRINGLLRKMQSGPTFSPDNENFIEIPTVDKPPNRRSTKLLRRLIVEDVINTKDAKTFKNVDISDEDIDKLFNSNCGPFEEVKKPTKLTAPITLPPDKSKSTTTPSTSLKTSVSKTLELQEPTASNITLTALNEESTISSKDDSNKHNNKSLSDDKHKKVQTKNSNDMKQLVINRDRPLPPSPTCSAHFYTHWRELPDMQKYEYLKSIDLKVLSKILGAGFDSYTLSDCFRIIRDFYLPSNESATAETLLEISRNEQFTILALLMSSEDRKALLEIMNWLKEQTWVKKEILNSLKTNFNLI